MVGLWVNTACLACPLWSTESCYIKHLKKCLSRAFKDVDPPGAVLYWIIAIYFLLALLNYATLVFLRKFYRELSLALNLTRKWCFQYPIWFPKVKIKFVSESWNGKSRNGSEMLFGAQFVFNFIKHTSGFNKWFLITCPKANILKLT